MTYEDLIEAVKSPTYRNSRNLETPYSALLAVLELHRPIFNKIDEAEFFTCNTCVEGVIDGEFPCATIKAIAEEIS